MGRDASMLQGLIRDVVDFPDPGIVYKDITPLLADAEGFATTIDLLVDHGRELGTIDKVVGIEARGFTFAAAVAYRMGVGLIPVRKPGKLPYERVTETYQLEYGTDSLEIHVDAVESGEGVYVIDDVLATGGTAAATCRLVERVGGRISGLGFVIELGFLDGRAKLPDYEVLSLMTV